MFQALDFMSCLKNLKASLVQQSPGTRAVGKLRSKYGTLVMLTQLKYLWIRGNTALDQWIFGSHCQSRILQLLLVPALLTNVWCLHMFAICWVHSIALMSTETGKLASKHGKTAFCTLFQSQSSSILKSILLKSLWLHNSFWHSKVDPQRMHHMETSTIEHLLYTNLGLQEVTSRSTRYLWKHCLPLRRSKELGAPTGRDCQPQWPRAKLCRAHRDECSCESELLVCWRLHYMTHARQC